MQRRELRALDVPVGDLDLAVQVEAVGELEADDGVLVIDITTELDFQPNNSI